MFAVAAMALIAVPVVTSNLTDAAEDDVHVFVIPAGTADRIAAGDDVEVIPADLDLALRDRLVLVNHDDATHQVASFVVGPGERVETRFSEAATVSGSCSLHPSGRIVITVDGAARPIDDPDAP